MIAEYLGKVGYIQGNAMQGFLVSMSENLESLKKINKKIALLGCCENTLYAEKLLGDYGIKVDYYTDSSPKFQGTKLAGGGGEKTILSPYPLFKQDVYFIITVPGRSIACARLQLMTHNIENYSIFLNCTSFDFADENPELQNRIMESINELVFEGETPDEAMPFIGPSSGGNGAFLGILNGLLDSLRCSQWAYPWEHKLIEEQHVERVLEVGPGYGLMSLVLLKGFPNIAIDWILLGEKHWELASANVFVFEKWLRKIKNKYSSRVNGKYGYIEREDFPIDAKYSLIIMTEVFEHFALNPVNTMRRLKNMLKTDGKMILTTPNWGHVHIYETWKEMLDAKDVDDESYLKLCQRCQFGHSYQYSKDELLEIFDIVGLQVDQYAVTISNHHSFVLSIKE